MVSAMADQQAEAAAPPPEMTPLRPALSAAEAHAWAVGQIEALYRKHHRLVFHLGLRYGRGDVAWAEDVTQEVFVHLFDVIKGLRDLDDMEGWLYRATTNRCLNRLRRERFLAHREEVERIYDQRFVRMWEFYLASSEMAFRERNLMVFQIQLTKRQDVVPMTRDYIMREEQRLRHAEQTRREPMRLAGE